MSEEKEREEKEQMFANGDICHLFLSVSFSA